MPNNSNSQVLEQFVDRLMAEKKLDGLDEAVKLQMKEDLLLRAEEAVKATIFSNLPEEKLPEFNSLLEAGQDENLQAFIKEAIPNMAELTAQALLDMRAAYLG